MRKKLIILGLLIVGLFPLLVNAEIYRENSTTNSNAIVIDDTVGIYTNEQIAEIKNSMRPLLEKGNVVLKTTKSALDFNGIQTPTLEEYNKLFGTANGTIVLINIYNGEAGSEGIQAHNSMYITSFGNNKNIISGAQEMQIIWENTPLLKEGKYLEAAKTGFEKIKECFDGGRKVEENSNNQSKESTTTANSKSIAISKDLVVIEDDAGLLTEEESQKLLDVMTPLTEYGHIIFKTINSNDTSTENYAHNYYYEHFGNESGTMLIIDMANRYIYICSAGENYKVITKDKANIITDNIYKYASNEKYYDCAVEAFNEIKTVLDGGKIAEPMRYASNIGMALVSGFLLSFLFVVSSMSVKRSSNSKKIEKLGQKVSIISVNIRQTGQRKVYSPVSDDSGFSSGGGGGFSGGGGGGGGFSGGGGGHSF